jgi:hypothetical protein
MKTITRKPAKAAKKKPISPPADSESETLSRPRLLSSDAKGRAGQSYWTIRRSDEPPPKDWGIMHVEHSPHYMLHDMQFGTIKALVKRLAEFEIPRAGVANLARMRLSEDGFQVEYFATLAAALAAEKETTGKDCCPFCMKSDMIEEIEWSGERFDGTDFRLPALRCNRCDMLAPKGIWQRMNQNQAETSPLSSKASRD